MLCYVIIYVLTHKGCLFYADLESSKAPIKKFPLLFMKIWLESVKKNFQDALSKCSTIFLRFLLMFQKGSLIEKNSGVKVSVLINDLNLSWQQLQMLMELVIFQEIGFSAIHIFFNDNPRGKDEIYFNNKKYIYKNDLTRLVDSVLQFYYYSTVHTIV